MGIYINPKDMTKEEWLDEHSDSSFNPFEDTIEWPSSEANWLPVALIDNGPFTAAAVCYCYDEFYIFSNDRSGRDITWYKIPKAALNEVTGQDLSKYYNEKSRTGTY